MESIRTYAIGNGEITLTDHDAEELRIILQTQHLEKVIRKIITENKSDFYFSSPSKLRHFVEEMIRLNDDLIGYDSLYFEETLEENIYNKASEYGFLR